MVGGKQLGLSDDEITTATKQAKRENLLSEMEAVVTGTSGTRASLRAAMAGDAGEFRVAMKPGKAVSCQTQQREGCRT